MKKFITLALLALPLFVFAQQRLDLSGEWKVSLNNSGDQKSGIDKASAFETHP